MGFRALVVEDSTIYQKVMVKVLGTIGDIVSVDVAGTGLAGLTRIAAGDVDVVFLDMNLPDMTGLEILSRLRGRTTAPKVIVVSAMGGAGTSLTVSALEHGALSYVRKPSGADLQESLTILKAELVQAVATLSAASRQSRVPLKTSPSLPRIPSRAAAPGEYWITAIAASTGGPQALAEVIPCLPADFATPIVVVQHMPPVFTALLAKNLDESSHLHVVEAQDGMIVREGFVFIAPGDRHMTLQRGRGRIVVRLNDEPMVCNVRPAADVLFESIAALDERSGALAVVMTGMGKDGTAGVTALKRGRCYCLTQSRDSSVVYGMPRTVDEAGLSDQSVDLRDLARRLIALQPTRVLRR